jgi:hypothetical protein
MGDNTGPTVSGEVEYGQGGTAGYEATLTRQQALRRRSPSRR